MKKITVLLSIAIVAQVLLSAHLRSQDSSKIKLENKISFKAQPFALENVRLLDGPFREAMLRDQKFLLDLDPDRLLRQFSVFSTRRECETNEK